MCVSCCGVILSRRVSEGIKSQSFECLGGVTGAALGGPVLACCGGQTANERSAGKVDPGGVGLRRRLGAEAADDPGAVGVVERDELGGDDAGGLVDLLGGGGGVLVDE